MNEIDQAREAMAKIVDLVESGTCPPERTDDECLMFKTGNEFRCRYCYADAIYAACRLQANS